MNKINEMYGLIIETRKKICLNYKFEFCNSDGVRCWFEMDERQFNFDATNGFYKNHLYGKFIDETIVVNHWFTDAVILTQNTTEEVVTNVLGESVYHEFVSNFKDLLANYEEPKDRLEMAANTNSLSKKFLDMMIKYCDKEGSVGSVVSGDTYLKRFDEIGMLDLDGFCKEMNYVFFVGRTVLTPDLFGKYNVDEIIAFIKEKSILGNVLN